jgi:hypothetical protein
VICSKMARTVLRPAHNSHPQLCEAARALLGLSNFKRGAASACQANDGRPAVIPAAEFTSL